MYKNKEGYADPTAAIAIGQAMKEYKANQKQMVSVSFEDLLWPLP